MILLSIISIIIFIAIYYYLFLTNTETYSNNSEIYFMSKQELNNFLEQDKDKYVNNLSDIDLNARKVKTKKEYIDNIRKTSCDLNDNEKGETYFPKLDISSPCKKGSILIFPPLWPWLHGGAKPINKSKYIVGSYLHTKDKGVTH